MNSRLPLLSALVCATLTVGTSSAQDIDVPSFSTQIEGNSLFSYPFSFNQCRTQLLVDASALSNKRVIRSVSFRPDGGGSTTSFAATQLTVALRAYQVTTSAATMTTTWANNIGAATASLTYNGTLNLPAFSVRYPLPNPYTIRVPFRQPFIRTTPARNVLLDWQATAPNYQFSRYNIDAVTYPTSAASLTSRVFRNTACTNTRGDTLTISISRTTGVLGGPLDVRFRATPATGGKLDVLILMLGADNKRFGGSIPLPLALGSAFPNCSLAIDPLISLAAAPIKLPNNPMLADTQLYTLLPGARPGFDDARSGILAGRLDRAHPRQPAEAAGLPERVPQPLDAHEQRANRLPVARLLLRARHAFRVIEAGTNNAPDPAIL